VTESTTNPDYSPDDLSIGVNVNELRHLMMLVRRDLDEEAGLASDAYRQQAEALYERLAVESRRLPGPQHGRKSGLG
jgi:hypothetical protein